MALQEDTKELAQAIIEACQEIKGKNIIGLDLSDRQSYTDFIVIVSGGSDRQVHAIADNILKKVFKKFGLHPLGTEGYDTSEWILIDFADVVVHVFNEEVRDDYHLEDMWINTKPVEEDEIENYFKSSKVASTS